MEIPVHILETKGHTQKDLLKIIGPLVGIKKPKPEQGGTKGRTGKRTRTGETQLPSGKIQAPKKQN